METQQKGMVLITGAAGGIGRACAAAFADSRKLLVDRDGGDLARIAGPDDIVVSGDLSLDATMDAIVECLRAEGGLAAGIHAAGISPTMGSASSMLLFNYGVSRCLVERLFAVALPDACLVLIASLAGHRPLDAKLIERLNEAEGCDDLRRLAHEMDSTTAYALAKYGVVQLAERAASHWGQRHARIVSLSPGVIDTPMQAAEADASDAINGLLAMAPIPRLGRPAEIAATARFLCSCAAGFITGCDIRVDGGAVAAIRQAARQ